MLIVGSESHHTSVQQRNAELMVRILWAPCLANGAIIVALLGIVANANDQDAALSALALPLMIFGAGILVGAIGLLLAAVFYRAQEAMTDEAHSLQRDYESLEQARLLIREFPINRELAAMVYGSQQAGDAEIIRLWKEHRKLHDQLDERFKAGVSKFKSSLKGSALSARASWSGALLAGFLSLLLATAGLRYVTIDHYDGTFRLTPATSSPTRPPG